MDLLPLGHFLASISRLTVEELLLMDFAMALTDRLLLRPSCMAIRSSSVICFLGLFMQTLPFPARTDPILHIFIVLHIYPRLNATSSKSVAFNLGKVHLLLNFTGCVHLPLPCIIIIRKKQV